MNTTLRRLATGGLVALTLAGTVVIPTAPAFAQCYGYHCGWYGHRHGRGWGVPLAAGIIGGLAVGAIAAGAATAPPPPPVYGPGGPYYGPPGQCYYAPRPVYDQWGNYAGTRPTEVCE